MEDELSTFVSNTRVLVKPDGEVILKKKITKQTEKTVKTKVILKKNKKAITKPEKVVKKSRSDS